MASRKKPHPRKRPTPSRQQNARQPAEPRCTALRAIDQSPFLKKAAADCRRLRTELDKKRDRLSTFEETEKPAYDRWLHATFGRELTAIRELRAETDALKFILHHLDMCDMLMPEKLREVHFELFRRKEEGTLYAFEPPRPDGNTADPDDEDEGDDGAHGGPDADWQRDMRDAFEQAFREFFEGDDDEDFHGGDHSSGDGDGASARNRQPVDPALKALYRVLAKRLHPDHSRLEETVRERRWHELQEAYENHDREAMQRIEAICDMDDTGISLKLGLARLRELAAYHREHLIPVRRALKEAKKDPAFGFSPDNDTEHRGRVSRELEDIRWELAYEVDELRKVADQFAEEAEEEEKEAGPEEDDDWDPIDNLFPEPRGSGVRV